MNVEKLSLSNDVILSDVGFVHHYSVAETYPLHSHDFYEFFLVVKGHAIHNINGESQILSSGSLVLIRPTDIHKYDFFNHYDFELLSIGFTCSSYEKACNMLNINQSRLCEPILSPHIILDGYNLSDINRKLFHISSKAIGIERRTYFLSILPYILYRFIDSTASQRTDELLPIWLIKLIDNMQDKDNIVGGLPRLLELTNISQEHLTREFRRHLNMTPTEFINMKRLQYATELLLSQKHEIMDVCFMCGYNNLSHFYHMFKKQYNCTPRQFLKNFPTE